MGCGRLPGYSGFYVYCWEIFKKKIIEVIWINLIIRVTRKKIFSATEKNPKNPKNLVFTIRPGEIDTSPGLSKKF
jgi:hypothetical protein